MPKFYPVMIVCSLVVQLLEEDHGEDHAIAADRSRCTGVMPRKWTKHGGE